MIATQQPVKILIVDDDDEDFYITSNLIKNITGSKFKIDWCHEYSKAVDFIIEGEYDLYFVDFLLGAKTGLDLIEEVARKHSEKPIVLLTGNGNMEIDIKAMQAGAADYLVKPELTTEKIERCIRYSLERSSALKALQANEQKFRNIFERSRDVILLADEDLFIKDINDAVKELLGYERENLLGRNLYDLLIDHTDRVAIREELSLQGDVDDKEVAIFTRNGEKRYSILSLSKETDVSGAYYVQGIIHDITNLKKAEKATLQVEKLRVTGRLVRTLAHEVRNPLNNINLAAVQLKGDLSEDNTLFLQIIQRNSQRIGDIISELLHSARPPEGKQQRADLRDIVNKSVEAASDSLTLKKITLKTSYPDESACIMADPDKLKIALLNIIVNAIEAMEEGKGVLTIQLKKTHRHVVVISDNGSGINEENLSRLFEPYFTSKRNGLGLGLATTLNILQSHQAAVDVDSHVDEGTTFMISFVPA